MRHVVRYFLCAFTSATMMAAPPVQAQEHVTKIKPSQLVTNGESFFEASNITSELTRLARRDGFIGANESFKTISKSAQPLSVIITQYKNCNPKPTYLISDGAGIDLMSSSDIQGLSNKLKQYLEEMKKGGTKKLLWMIYPDPQGATYANLKKNQDLWAVAVPPIINACTEPKTLLVDLRPVWAGKYSQYTKDGIHCTDAGGTATAEAFWKAMMENNFFDTLPVVSAKQPLKSVNIASSAVLGQRVENGRISLSLSLNQPSNVTVHLTTVSGRSVFSASRQTVGAGLQKVNIETGALAKGLYCCEVKAGLTTSRSTLLVH